MVHFRLRTLNIFLIWRWISVQNFLNAISFHVFHSLFAFLFSLLNSVWNILVSFNNFRNSWCLSTKISTFNHLNSLFYQFGLIFITLPALGIFTIGRIQHKICHESNFWDIINRNQFFIEIIQCAYPCY